MWDSRAVASIETPLDVNSALVEPFIKEVLCARSVPLGKCFAFSGGMQPDAAAFMNTSQTAVSHYHLQCGFEGSSEMAGFDDAWAAVAGARNGEPVSPQLQPLLRRVYADVLAQPSNLAALKASLTALLEYLTGPGRTNANCWAVDLFFMSSEGWEKDWTERDLPDDFHDVLALMGESLHDTVKSPEIADNFDCLPEQLLERVRRLKA